MRSTELCSLLVLLLALGSGGCGDSVSEPDAGGVGRHDARVGRDDGGDAGETDSGEGAARDAGGEAGERDAGPRDGGRLDGMAPDARVGSGRCNRPERDLPIDVYLSPGDDFQAANDANPAGTTFGVRAGVHRMQRVVNPREGNRWVGEPGAVMDGQDVLPDAFSGAARRVQIIGIELRRYVDNGIFFRGGGEVLVEGVSVFDSGSGDGEANGAVRFDGMTNLTVAYSHFERVSSGVLPSNCTGPIVIEYNTGLNIGRNFVQLAWVDGPGIRVRYNSMERDGTYVRPGNDDVEDWISAFSVDGRADDYVQISFNRARGHGPSSSGSFIMLGDGGGSYQEARGNIGVTPGQVGVGLAGGRFIRAVGNRMFSESWENSNIAFYSADFSRGPCGDHVVEGNAANWLNADGRQNTFWTAGDCTPLTETDNTFPDPGLDATVWEDWSPPCTRS